MNSEISIKVNIADVVYPLTIAVKDEENVRKAAKMINEEVRQYREEFGISDKANILSMIALRLASELLSYHNKDDHEIHGIGASLRQLNELIAQQI